MMPEQPALNHQMQQKTVALRNQNPYDPLVIAQLVAFVKYNDSPHKLSVLRRHYDERLQVLGSDWIGASVHSTRFKEHL